MPMPYITCFTFSALMISTFMKRLAAAVVASHITITAGLHVYGKRKRLQEDDDYEESKVKGQGVCVCLNMYMSMDVSGIPLTSTIAAYFHLYFGMKTSFIFWFFRLQEFVEVLAPCRCHNLRLV